MAINYGKAFEARFKADFLKIPNSTIDRLYDVTQGYFGIRQVCDFIGFVSPHIWYLEVKTIKGNTFPLSNLKQYDKLLTKKDVKGAKAGVVLWFTEHDKIIYIPISTFERLVKDEKKSYNIKYLNDNTYKVYEIPTKKKRTFLEGDYTVLLDIEE